MKAGRELDALAHELVMKGEVVPDAFGAPMRPGSDWVSDPDGDFGVGPVKTGIPIPRYSTEIAAAWEVVENLRGRGFSVGVFTWDDDEGAGVTVEVSWGKVKHTDRGQLYQPVEVSEMTADTAPEAICLAALKAVGHDIEGAA